MVIEKLMSNQIKLSEAVTLNLSEKTLYQRYLEVYK
mgnify:CR=1 FL=1